MANTNFINLFDLKDWSMVNEGLGLIEKLQEIGAIPTNLKCCNGHIMTLTRDSTRIDNYKWKCRQKLGGPKRPGKFCNYR